MIGNIEADEDYEYEVVSTPDGVTAEISDRDCAEDESGHCFTFDFKTERSTPEGETVIAIKVTDNDGRENVLDYVFVVDATP